MNCRPNDIARIVAPYAAIARDRLVEVVRLMDPAGEALPTPDGGICHYTAKGNGPCWLVRGRIPSGWGFDLSETFIADECLRPIRDPGSDAVDETLSWRPLPLPAIQPELLDEVHAHG